MTCITTRYGAINECQQCSPTACVHAVVSWQFIQQDKAVLCAFAMVCTLFSCSSLLCVPLYHKHALPPYHRRFDIPALCSLFLSCPIVCISVPICFHFCPYTLPCLAHIVDVCLFVCSALSHLTLLSLYHHAAVSLPPHRLPHHAGVAQVSSGQVPPACREVSRPVALLHLQSI